VVCVLVAYAYSVAVGLTAVNTTVLTLTGFFGGFLLFVVTMKVVSSAVSTVYVCFAERPDAFAVRLFCLHNIQPVEEDTLLIPYQTVSQTVSQSLSVEQYIDLES
jgi:hypothetical protein